MKPSHLFWIRRGLGLAALLLIAREVSAAPEAEPPAPQAAQAVTVTLSKQTTEDEGDVIAAKVMAADKAVADVAVSFCVPRLFGTLTLGEATTNEEGVAAIPFPRDLPGDATTGELSVTATVVDSTSYAGKITANVAGGRKLEQTENPFPRAIWSTKTDLHLLLTIPVLLLCVWSVYVFSVSQLVKVFRLRSKP